MTEKEIIHRVFWMEDGEPKSKAFVDGEIDAVLKYCEQLRNEKADGANVGFIVSASENPNHVSNGVAAPPADYDWQKRRGGRK